MGTRGALIMAACLTAASASFPAWAQEGAEAAAIERSRDAGAALGAAWTHFNRGDTAQAKHWFGRALEWRPGAAEARYGLALCAFREERFDDALEAARALPAGTPDRGRLIQDSLLGKARAAYEAKDYAQAAATLREAEKQGPLPRYGRSQYAWTLLQLGEAEAAAAVFERLHREKPDEESAQGFALSVQRLIDEKRFAAAARADPSIAASLGAAGTRHATLGAGWRHKSGDEGTSRLHARVAPSLEVSTPVGESAQAAVRIDRVVLDSGSLPASALVGSAGAGAFAFDPITRVEGEQAQIYVRIEGEALWQLGLGITPSGGPLGEHAFGRVERRGFASWGTYDVAAYAEPVRESILSYVGLRDPYTGAAWGRVSRNGAEARALWLFAPDWAATGALAAEALEGEAVADNDYFQASGGIGRNLGLRGFNYAVLALEGGIDGYRRNLSQFTLGHGGYYSPQRTVRGGIAFNFQTDERRAWLVRGRASAGRVYREQDEAPLFPLAPDGRTYAGSRDYGNDGGLELSAAWQVTAHLQLGGALALNVAPQYDSVTAVALLRVLLEPRSAVTSADLVPARLLEEVR